MSDEKRLEKLWKRAKPFLDEKLKSKQRLNSLFNFMENASDADQNKFFQENDFQIYSVMYDAFSHQVEKIRCALIDAFGIACGNGVFFASRGQAREKADKVVSLTGKEVGDLIKILGVLKKVFIFMPERINNGWQRRSIVGILQTLLDTSNHPKLRLEGFRALLLWLNTHTSEPPESMHIFANAIPLCVFEPFALPLPEDVARGDGTGHDETGPIARSGAPEWKGGETGRASVKQVEIECERRVHYIHSPTHADASEFRERWGCGGRVSALWGGPMDKSPLIPSPAPPSTYDVVELVDELLQNLANLAAAAAAAASAAASDEMALERAMATPAGVALAFTWATVKRHYFRLLFPVVARKIGIVIEDGEGFPTCPPQILYSLINFLLRNLLHQPPLSSTASSPVTASNQIRASTVLRMTLMTNEADREIIHEIVRQSLLLPFKWSDVTRGGIAILRAWVAMPKPLYVLRRVPPTNMAFTTATPTDPPTFSESRRSSKASLTPDQPTPPTDLVTCPQADSGSLDAFANVYVRRYIRYLRMVFLEKADAIEHAEAQVGSP
ncbi:hypothetical protein BDK51DRAFT_50230 [Blyttiomyces helicus]|uniref:Uncharacterized protein n=1 Tax=Blyttiomyces helicus TaxID=388810 RepID=A0A4P9WB72_9FUNG|nr:hypothetical protein BDK51DRAFT_50230 [Blyttiomyces helicus]|eukprot:RKO89859.1 hypothetical protein BDK51DRAFT_50230 [Blyttiomyces helicus]